MSLVASDLASFPAFPMILANATGSAMTFDGAADLVSLIFQIPKTGTISNIHYRIASISSPVLTHRIELRTVDMATGLPSGAGTLYGSSTSITDSSVTAGNKTAAVNATGATKGDIAAAVFDLSAFTSGSFTQQETITQLLAPNGPSNSGRPVSFPYGAKNTTGATALSADPMTCLALEYSDGFVAIPPGLGWVGTGGLLTTVTSTGATRRAGNAYTPTTPRRAIGFYALVDIDGDVTFTLRLAADDSVLATATPDKDTRGSTANSMNYPLFDSGATVNLSAGTAYYITMNGADATGGILYGMTNGVSTAMLACMPGGTNCYGMTHNGTDYTNLTTANAVGRYHIGLMTDQEDNGVGGRPELRGSNL